MPVRTWQLRVKDMLAAAERILALMSGKSLHDLEEDVSLLERVLFNFIILGEAANHIPEDVQGEHPEIPWKDVTGMRNVIAHGYFDVKITTVWGAITDDLPLLIPELERMLSDGTLFDGAAG